MRTPPLLDFIVYVDSTYPYSPKHCARVGGGGWVENWKRKKKETHFWKGVKALYRRNLIQLFEEGHALVIMAVLICKVYEVWLVHAPGVERGSGESRESGKSGKSGKRQKGEVGRDSWDSWTVDSGLLIATRAVAAAAESHVRGASAQTSSYAWHKYTQWGYF